MIYLDPVANFAKANLSAGIDDNDVSLNIDPADAGKFPNPSIQGAFNAVIYNATDFPNPADDPDVEIVRVTSRVSGTFAITRAQEGTAAAAHNTAGKVYVIANAITKKMIDDIATQSEASNEDATVARAHIETGVDQTIPGGAVSTKVNLATVNFDPNGYFDVVNKRFIASVAGYYQVNAAVYYQVPIEADAYFSCEIYKNGSIVSNSVAQSATTGEDIAPSISDVIYLDVDDYLELYTQNSQTVPVDITSGNGCNTFMSLALISAAAGSLPVAAVRAYKSASTQSIPTGVDTKITFDVETFDTGGNFASSRFTAPRAGYYSIKASLFWLNVEANKEYVAQIFKNGSLFTQGKEFSSTPGVSGDFTTQVADLIYLAAGEYIEIFGTHNGVSACLVSNTASATFISVFLTVGSAGTPSVDNETIKGTGIPADPLSARWGGNSQYLGTFNSEIGRRIICATSNEDGSQHYIVTRRTDGDTAIHRITKDPVTGALGEAQTASALNSMDTEGQGGLAVLGDYLYFFTYDGSGNLVGERMLATNFLTGHVTLTIAGSPTGDGRGVFSDGTALYIKLSAASATFTRYTVSGTTVTAAGGTRTGTQTDVISALFNDGILFLQNSTFSVYSFTVGASSLTAVNNGGIGMFGQYPCGLGLHTTASLFAFVAETVPTYDGTDVVIHDKLHAIAFGKPL